MTTGIAKIVKNFLGGGTENIAVITAFGGDEVFGETKDIDFGKPQFNKSIHSIVFSITERGNINDVAFYIGGRQRHEDALTWYGPYSLASADTQIYVRIPKYRYFRLKFRDTLPKKQWKFNAVEVYGRVYNAESGTGPRSRR